MRRPIDKLDLSQKIYILNLLFKTWCLFGIQLISSVEKQKERKKFDSNTMGPCGVFVRITY